MSVITANEDIDLGVPEAIREKTLAYLVVVLEERDDERLAGATEELAELLTHLGAPDVYVLPAGAARRLIEAREKAFWAAKGAGADDILDTVIAYFKELDEPVTPPQPFRTTRPVPAPA